ncbi:MAG: glycosyltransferase family 39 protein [Longimicrobiales bacterium]
MALKTVLALIADTQRPILDEAVYLTLAESIASEGRFPTTFRPPLYPAFLAAFLALGLGSVGARLAQAVLSTLTILLVYRITRRHFGLTVGRVAAGLIAFDPVLVSFSHRLWSETLFLFLLLVLIDRLLVAIHENGLAPWAVAGLALGLAGLTRPIILSFAPLLLPWGALQIQRRRRAATTPAAAGGWTMPSWSGFAARFALLTCAALFVVMPWTLRNLEVTGAPILVDSNGPFNFLVGNQPEAAYVDKDDFWSERFGRIGGERYEQLVVHDAARAQAAAMELARANIAAAPDRFLRKAAWEAQHLWTLDSFLLRHLRNGWYGPRARKWLSPLLTPVSAAFFAGLVIAGFAGLAVMAPSAFRGFALLYIGHATLVFGVTYSLSRYAVPLHALLVVPAAIVLAAPRLAVERLRWKPQQRLRVATLCVALLAVAGGWLRDLPVLWDTAVNGGAAHRYRFERAAAAERPEAAAFAD